MDASALAVVAVGFALFALVVVVAVAVRVGRLLRAYDGLVAGGPAEPFATSVGRQTAIVKALQQDVLGLRAELAATASDLSGVVRRVEVVRYDAFGDASGLLSFSVALLDDAGDGLVLSSINGRSETRTYAKAVRGGVGVHPLSPEEREAVEAAAAPRGES